MLATALETPKSNYLFRTRNHIEGAVNLKLQVVTQIGQTFCGLADCELNNPHERNLQSLHIPAAIRNCSAAAGAVRSYHRNFGIARALHQYGSRALSRRFTDSLNSASSLFSSPSQEQIHTGFPKCL